MRPTLDRQRRRKCGKLDTARCDGSVEILILSLSKDEVSAPLRARGERKARPVISTATPLHAGMQEVAP